MGYFEREEISNSDIKNFKKQIGLMGEDPPNLEEIFTLGTLIHATILEPHEANKNHKDYDLAVQMRETFWADKVCREFALADDFRREYLYHGERQVGPYKVKLRCKCDGARTRAGLTLELKGLGVESEKAFREALIRYDYDQALVHYLITSGHRMGLIVGISKKDPRRIFKWICKAHDEFYLGGEQKLIDSLELLRTYSPEDVRLA